MAILFISNVVPDRPPYNGEGFTRSGNNVLLGISQSIPGSETPELVSCRPISSFPRGPLWIKGETVLLVGGRKVNILPVLNIKFLKNILWGWQIRRVIREWAARYKDKRREVLVYNVFTPPISSVFRACKKNSCKLTAILYDLGIPPAKQKLKWLTMLGYRAMDRQAKKYIPLLDGRVVINERIVNHYSPGKSFILVDGGVGDVVVDRLFPLQRSRTEEFVFVLAGLLWDQNGTSLVMECMRQHPELPVKVIFAGNGIDVPAIQEYASCDSRVSYAGMLSPDELFHLYEKADVLLNLRIEENEDFHFPSKLFEYLATGKHVLSTPIAHAERDYGAFMTVLHEMTPSGLAEAINDIVKLGKETLLEQGALARAFILKRRTWEVRTGEIIRYMHEEGIGNGDN